MKRDSNRTLDEIVDGRDFKNLDCGDNSCKFIKARSGMRTNGGCRCVTHDAANVPYGTEKLLAQLVAEALEQRNKARVELRKASRLLHDCLEWDNGGERSYQAIVDFLNETDE